MIFLAGTLVDRFGADTRDQLWKWADQLLDYAHPPQPPVDIDIN